ncbi:MAG: D-hexose-6-phosphate mutarotase [Rheinheimera sp.]|uniref:D-hexose-6-phosphate mutarotase n=1 Tax=Arsukibacterium sp. UBA3155 TaxID=1946058 RepID=UPI000C96BFFD|nr:D-hexose-6-phosphate mutarotase [Arsukibacterium sp. UBA3155]MAD75866.1 D-hexose-6-phosphate mutarotase [Rheinheimera sp.]|tara:strand:+ start:26322 stop:27194 length:873 start_codon:yes stop_codon:yes gene_type:complete
MTIQPSVSQHTGFAQLTDLPCLTLQCANATAVLSLYGGQVLSYQPTAGNELLWLSAKAQWHNSTAIRGGVPVCWPWFGPVNPKLNPQQLPLHNHGLVRNRMWQLTHSKTTEDSVCVTLTITVDDIPASLWLSASEQQPVTLNLVVTLTSANLSMQLVCNTPLYQQAALHSYFTVSNLQQTLVTGLSPDYFDKVANAQRQQQDGVVHFTAETDRIYYDTGSQLHLSDDKQLRCITQQGHDASVIWNPWQQKSRDLPDMADNGFTEFVCVESAWLNISQISVLALAQTLQAP